MTNSVKSSPPQPWGSATMVSTNAKNDFISKMIGTDRPANTVVFRGKIRRGRTPSQVLTDTGWCQATENTAEMVTTMPLITSQGQEEHFEYVFFKPGKRISDIGIEVERAARGLVRDLEVLALISTLHPEFYENYNWPGRTTVDSWQDGDGNCFSIKFFFSPHFQGVHLIDVKRGGNVWPDETWFGGLKVSE